MSEANIIGDAARQLGLSFLPDFLEGVGHRAAPCGPAELYRCLFLDLEEHVHYLEPAFHFALAALSKATPPEITAASDSEYARALTRWSDTQTAGRTAITDDASLAQHATREFAPSGLSDGAWLHGAVFSNAVESELGMRLLRQLMNRFGGPGVGEAYVQRYAALLRSVGINPALITRRTAPFGMGCSELSFEHALLGVSLGLFPTTFTPEIVGFNLWMSSVGPCPLLESLQAPLRARGGSLRYFDLHDRATMADLATRAVEACLLEVHDEAEKGLYRLRIARGFCAAQRSYSRWEQAVLGAELALEGTYTAPQQLEDLTDQAFASYGELSNTELYHRFANVDLHPAVRLFAREYVASVFAKIAQVFETDARLNSRQVPAYSEQCIAEVVALQHEKNAKQRGQPNTSLVSSNSDEAIKGIQEVFDGCWLQGFVDVQRAELEEYGWLFRIYASEHGDGDFVWNHCQIFRKAFATLGPSVMLPKTDRRLYDLFEIGFAAMVTLGVSLNTRYFMPEILGINLGIESTGVGGSYMDQWKGAEKAGEKWRALAWRLHNSIDNYADGHTKWSLAAVQSFMRRVKDGAPESVSAQWQRVWRLWRCRDILVHGTEGEQAALNEYFQPGDQVLPAS